MIKKKKLAVHLFEIGFLTSRCYEILHTEPLKELYAKLGLLDIRKNIFFYVNNDYHNYWPHVNACEFPLSPCLLTPVSINDK